MRPPPPATRSTGSRATCTAPSRGSIPSSTTAADITGAIRLLSISRIESPVYDEFLAEFHRTHPRIDLQIEVMRSSDIISSLLQMNAADLAFLESLERHMRRYSFAERLGAK